MIWHRLDAFLTRIRPYRQLLSLLIDGLVVAAAWNATYLFRLGFERWWSARPGYDPWVMGGLVALYLLALVLLKVPRSMWRFSGFGEVQRLTVACGLAGLAGAVIVLMAQLTQVPRAVLALHPVISLMGLTLVRIAYRMLYEHMRAHISGSARETRRALILGAGHAARLLIAGIQHQGWVVVGLLDDDPAKRAARVGSLPVLGPLDSAAHWAPLHGITHLIVALPSATKGERRRALDLAAQTRLPVLTVPSAGELLEGRAVANVRDIEAEDLLGREPVVLDEGGISECLSGKTVLITGAGGSIGSELCRQVARYGPKRLVLYELSELALYTIEQEMSERFPQIPLVRLIGDVRDLAHLRHSFGKWRPQVVFHAAAYKHVPLMEEENAFQALRNNTLGTWYAARAAAEAGVERFVMISTDKAVNPTNVMGATKRAAEMVISHMAQGGQTPSPASAGEGRGEGIGGASTSDAQKTPNPPHPNPLPLVRERAQLTVRPELVDGSASPEPHSPLALSLSKGPPAHRNTEETRRRTRFMAVRFGNVLGSSGSVIPKFKEQIAKGGPVTVTHPEITRYFMTISEAARLVVQAAALGEGGQVFVLDMGDPVKIVDLARDLIRMAGRSEEEIPIVFSGLRPGEKLYEELLADADTTLPTRIARLRIARLNGEREQGLMAQWLEDTERAANGTDADVRVRLRQVVPELR
jgi:FlaA1/EpsC-like NDP-sugar epimerase